MIIEAREDTITLRGEIKTNIWAAIQAAAALLLKKHPTGIIIDASGVTRVTAKGAETFADAFKYIKAHNARIVVAGLAPELVEIGKEVPGVRSQLPLASTVEEARASLQLEEVTPQRGKARNAGLVPMVGNWRRALYYADKLAASEGAEIHLVDLIKVPMTLPIGAPLPEREAAGQRRLAEAAELVKKNGLRGYTHAEHVRSESAGLIDFAKRLAADFAVVSIDRPDRTEPYIEESEATSLLQSASFEVSLLKGSPSDPTHVPKRVAVPAVGAWKHAAEHACALITGEDSVLTVVYPIVVPRTEPIDAPKPDAEAAASDMAKEIQRIAKHHGVKAQPVTERLRDPVIGFARMLESGGFDLAVVGVGEITAPDFHIAQAIASTLLQDVPCEVIYLRAGQ